MKETNPSTFLTIDETKPAEQEFHRIANSLINEFNLMVNETSFSLFDFEFYYFSLTHKDGYTFPHSKPIGDLRMHDYGIDISLGFSGNKTYGGILIRGAWMSDLEHSKEPQTKSQFEISMFNSLRIGHNSIYYSERNQVDKYKCFNAMRKSLGRIEPSIHKTFDMMEAKYRFIIDDYSAFSTIKGKEEILRNSNLDRTEWSRL